MKRRGLGLPLISTHALTRRSNLCAFAALAGHVKSDSSAADIHSRFTSFFAGEPLVRVLPAGEMPDVRSHGTGQHGVTVGGFTYDPKTRRVACVSVIDNLLKGAATQAVQNINIALGFPEYEGIPLSPAAQSK